MAAKDIGTKAHSEQSIVRTRYARDLNALAESCGFQVLEIFKGDNDRGCRLFAHWIGDRERLLAMQIVPPAARIPITKGRIFDQSDRGVLTHFECEMKPSAHTGLTEFVVDLGPAPQSIENRGGIEIADLGDHFLYQGDTTELIKVGLLASHQLPYKNRGSRRSDTRWREGPQWQTRTALDGSIRLWIEKDETRDARFLEASQEESRLETEAMADHVAKMTIEREHQERNALDPTSFRREILRMWDVCVVTLSDLMFSKDQGRAFSPEVQDEFRNMAWELRELINEGQSFSTLPMVKPRIMARTAEFSHFLDRLTDPDAGAL